MNVWPALVDVFAGFLAIALLAAVVIFSSESAPPEDEGIKPPPQKEEFISRFQNEFEDQLLSEESTVEEPPEVFDTGFAEVKIYFPAAFLFDICGIQLKPGSSAPLSTLRELLAEFNQQISRVQITGHTDSDPPTPGSYCFEQGIEDNWELSALRAISVVRRLAPDDGSGLDPAKVWATALAQHHPVVEEIGDEAKARNRRIELVIRFTENRVNSGMLPEGGEPELRRAVNEEDRSLPDETQRRPSEEPTP